MYEIETRMPRDMSGSKLRNAVNGSGIACGDAQNGTNERWIRDG
jgi:hypothetical protein